MDCPNCFGDGSVIIGEQDPQRDHPATCPECLGMRKVKDTTGVRLCRAFHGYEPSKQDTEADNVYLNARSHWDRLAEAAEYVRQADDVLEEFQSSALAAILESIDDPH